jgi:hypothetical protein
MADARTCAAGSKLAGFMTVELLISLTIPIRDHLSEKSKLDCSIVARISGKSRYRV